MAAYNSRKLFQSSRLSVVKLAICCPITVASGVVVVVVVGVGGGVCNRSQMRTSKCTCLIFVVIIRVMLSDVKPVNLT